MPSIDLIRLRSEIQGFLPLAADPPQFRQAIRDLMARYARRSIRRSRSMARRSALPAWEVPPILMRELDAVLCPAVARDPATMLAAMDILWEGGRLEERILSCRAAQHFPEGEQLLRRLNKWLERLEDPVLLEELAKHACKPFHRSQTNLFQMEIRIWLESTVPATRRFGWMALQEWLLSNDTRAILASWNLLPLAFLETDFEALRLSAVVFQWLCDHAAEETRHWLDGIPLNTYQANRNFFRAVLPCLPLELSRSVREKTGMH